MDIDFTVGYKSHDFREPAQKRQRLDHDQLYSADSTLQTSTIGQSNSWYQNVEDSQEPEEHWVSEFNDQQSDPSSWLNPTQELASYSNGSGDIHESSSNFSNTRFQRHPTSESPTDLQDLSDEQSNDIDGLEIDVSQSDHEGEDLLCFGMISDVPFMASQSSLLTTDTSNIALSFTEPNMLFQLGRISQFGELDDRTAKILANLRSEEGIKFQIYCRTINRRAAQGKKGGRKVGANELQYVMNAIICGPKDLCDPVGFYLTKCGVFLQDPLNCDGDYRYSNPHILSRSEELIMTSSLLALNAMSDVEQVTLSEDLFAELSADDHLSLTEAPDAIKTPLYVHQKKALTFMTKREEGWQHDGSQEDLWVKEVDETGQMTYCNMITEIPQKTAPPDSRGGLLADQMGLGKSLTMISLIALNTCKARELIVFAADGVLRRLKSTLVVVPYSLLEVWNTQLKRHLKQDTLTWMRFHSTRKMSTLDFARHDIVITTFETLLRQHKKHLNQDYKEDTVFSFSWHRIVLDEGISILAIRLLLLTVNIAHTIRNRATAMARASCAIQATNRWAITGTPIQNRVTDFSSLLEYLQVYPFSIPKVFDDKITKPWLKSNDRDISPMKKLVNCISLCRTKAIIDLPRRRDLVLHLDFNPEEQVFYNTIKDATIRKFDDAMASNPVHAGQYINALQWLNELRLLCNHGLAQAERNGNKSLTITPQDIQKWNKSTANKAFETIVCDDQAICSVCKNVLTDGGRGTSSSEFPKPFLSKCLTLTCGSCIKDSLSGKPVPTCLHMPVCKSIEVSWASDHVEKSPSEKALPALPPEQASTKLKALLESLQTCPPGEKSVVFSYWTYTLDLVESLLRQTGITYTRIDGQHSGEKRDEAIEKFQTDETIQVILVSITCGGAGLDLTAASVAYLLEPQWNPMMEEQALCRIHRLGQTKEVKTVRYRMKGSFEDKVVAIQELKKQIAADAFATDVRRSHLDNAKQLEQLRTHLIGTVSI